MNYLSKMFIKKRIFSDIIFDDLKYDLEDEVGKPAEVSLNKEHKVANHIRSATKKQIDATFYPDFCKEIEALAEEFSPRHQASTLVVKEIEYLQYGISDHFTKHQDALRGVDEPRRFTSITMLSKTDDMVGGQLSVFEGDKEHVIDLQVGETTLFFSTTWHQVTAVTKGGREVLVAWVYDS
jgi:predicted 2-oxoglutarate/Fe(II)-dependent dioxygenase YbiX